MFQRVTLITQRDGCYTQKISLLMLYIAKLSPNSSKAGLSLHYSQLIQPASHHAEIADLGNHVSTVEHNN